MQTQILPQLLNTASGRRADEILRKCVHCGFCTATCPTYQLLGDELDGPRGRIYQIKQMLEGLPTDRETQVHLDRCLTCRSCETTCPSGVNYAELVDIGRAHIEQQNLRPLPQKFMRNLLGAVLPYRSHNQWLFRLGGIFRGMLPATLKSKTPVIRAVKDYADQQIAAQKTILLLDGCVQSTISPNTNAAAKLILTSLGYQVIHETTSSCCGAVNHHLSQTEKAEQWVINNLQQWTQLNQQHELHAIVSTATGCGIMLKDYSHILENIGQAQVPDEYKALCEKIVDISELLDADKLQQNLNNFRPATQKIAYHAPCTLTHGHKLADTLYQKLNQLGYQLSTPRNAHLCCGSAGTYSLLQPEISKQLRDNKIEALNENTPDVIITANVGCEHHLDSASDTPVRHWVEIVANDIQRSLQNSA